jgi:hypothetical protein
MSKNKTLLWLDDYRCPFNTTNEPAHPYLQMYCPDYVDKEDNIVWVKNYEEFCNWISENGLPNKVSFDHDLADEHYAPEERYDDYNVWASEQEFKEKTGMDCAKWLIDYCLDINSELPMWSVHSANPSGAENIRKLLTNFLKFQNKQKTIK